MGANASRLSQRLSKRLSASNAKDESAGSAGDGVKLCLLGAADSGKSTVLKQLKILFREEHGFTDEERLHATKVVYHNIITSMITLLGVCKSYTPAVDEYLADELVEQLKLLLVASATIDEALGAKLTAIWRDAGVQATWAGRNSFQEQETLKYSNFQVQETLEYFMSNMGRIQAANYSPTNQDIIQSLVKTNSIKSVELIIDGVRTNVFDVGGERGNRMKWIHTYEKATAVIFMAAMSEYDQALYEDSDTPRQEDSLDLLAEMRGSEWFRDKPMILLLNKSDLFRKKLLTVPFKVEDGPHPRNVDYKGPVVVPGTASAEEGTPEFEAVCKASTEYLVDLYKSAGKEGSVPGELHIEVTCATDTDQIAAIAQTTKDIIKRGKSE